MSTEQIHAKEEMSLAGNNVVKGLYKEVATANVWVVLVAIKITVFA